MRSALVSVFGLAFLLAGCSGIKSYELVLRGSPDLNLNEDNQPNPVQVKVLRLKGEDAANAFRSAPFDDLWDKPEAVPAIQLQGAVQSIYVPARTDRVVLAVSGVPPEVTHIGLLALFNKPETNKERLVMPRDQIEEADIWLVGSVLGAPAPGPEKTENAATTPGADQAAKKDKQD